MKTPPWTYDGLVELIESGRTTAADMNGMDDAAFEAAMRLSSASGRTIAHDVVTKGYFGRDKAHLLFLADTDGWTVAHEAARISYDGNEPFDGTFDQTPEIARLATKTGVTVAHRLAKAGILSPALRTDDILSMEALGGLTVRELLELADGGFFERKERERELVRRADKAERIAEEAEGTRCGPFTCPGEASGHPARSSTNHEQHTRRR